MLFSPKKQLLFLLFLYSTSVFSQDYSKHYQSIKNAVVYVLVEEVTNAGLGDRYQVKHDISSGSGVLIDDNHILTAAHVVKNAEKILIRFENGEEVYAVVEKSSTIADLALLKINSKPSYASPVKLASNKPINIGQKTFLVGYPLGMSKSLSSGNISAVHIEEDAFGAVETITYLQTDAAINHGNSGGPMFNEKGEVIGIVSSIISQSGGFEGLGFAVSIETIYEEIINSKGNHYFGLNTLYIDGPLARALNFPQNGGLLIQNVVKGTAAYKAGLRGGFIKIQIQGSELYIGGDVILSINGITLDSERNMKDLQGLKNQFNLIGQDKIEVDILREGKVVKLYLNSINN